MESVDPLNADAHYQEIYFCQETRNSRCSIS